MAYGDRRYGDGGYGLERDQPPRLTFLVADTLTGRLIGRVHPSTWTWDDPLTGISKGGLTLALPNDPDEVVRLAAITRPLACQVCVHDDDGRWWFGGPITAEPSLANRQLGIAFADWRAWFYASDLDADYVVDTQEQMTVASTIAAQRLATQGAPRMVLDDTVNSNVQRAVTARRGQMAGAVFDDIANRDNGFNWWTFLTTDPDDETRVLPVVRFHYPERDTGSRLYLRYRLGSGGNLLGYEWPDGNAPVTRIVASQGTAPDQLLVIAEDPAVTSGDIIAWAEPYALPDGTTPTSAFDYAFARLVSRRLNSGTVTVTIDPAATDVGGWGPGDRVRLAVSDGWRDVDLPSARIISRTLTGRGENLLTVKASIALGEPSPDIETPDLAVI